MRLRLGEWESGLQKPREGPLGKQTFGAASSGSCWKENGERRKGRPLAIPRHPVPLRFTTPLSALCCRGTGRNWRHWRRRCARLLAASLATDHALQDSTLPRSHLQARTPQGAQVAWSSGGLSRRLARPSTGTWGPAACPSSGSLHKPSIPGYCEAGSAACKRPGSLEAVHSPICLVAVDCHQLVASTATNRRSSSCQAAQCLS